MTGSKWQRPLWVAFTLSMLAQPAPATDLAVRGGPGGGHFRSECSGDFVVGIYVKSGAWIDAIGLKCASFNSAQGTFKRPPWNKAFHGGNGGGHQERVCPANSVVTEIRFGFTREGSKPKYLDFVALTCRKVNRERTITTVDCLATGDGCWTRHPSSPAFLNYNQTCGDEEVAVGIHGRSGAYVDALGLICGPKPR
jgi:hypothetical protein